MSKAIKNAEAELVLVREIDVPRHLVWKAWTTKEHLEQWWCPRPYSTTVIDMDVRPSGAFNVQMHAPDGSDLPRNNGCYIEVVENEKLTFTSCLLEGFRPAPEVKADSDNCDFPMTAIITFEDLGGGKTRYTARALHRNEADRVKHEKMGFHDGWGTVVDQLVEYVKANL